MNAAVLVEGTQGDVPARRVDAVVSSPGTVLVGHDAQRDRELDLVAATVEGAAEGLALFLLLALAAIAFTVITLSGVLH